MKLKRILVSLLVSVMLPANVAVAEPSIGTFGSDALAQASILVAQPSLDRFTGRRIKVEISGYTLSIEETDDRPWETANGADLRKPSNRYTVASNDLPFGTRVIFPSIDPYTEYVVQDRMNGRYKEEKTGKINVDIFMGEGPEAKASAKQLGRRNNMEMIVLD